MEKIKICVENAEVSTDKFFTSMHRAFGATLWKDNVHSKFVLAMFFFGMLIIISKYTPKDVCLLNTGVLDTNSHTWLCF